MLYYSIIFILFFLFYNFFYSFFYSIFSIAKPLLLLIFHSLFTRKQLIVNIIIEWRNVYMSLIDTQAFLVNYLYNKFSHMPINEPFSVNYGDIEKNLDEYVASTYTTFIKVVYKPLKDFNIDESSLSNFKMLNRTTIAEYSFIKRDEFLSLLKAECSSYNATYTMTPLLKCELENNGISTDKIKDVYKEWYARSQLRLKTYLNVANYNRSLGMRASFIARFINFNIDLMSRGLPHYHLNIHIKEAGYGKDKYKYVSYRITNDICSTKNDLEKQSSLYKNTKNLRSNFISHLINEKNFSEMTDLGDMTACYPNLLNCIKTGEYIDFDFHSKIAEKYNIPRNVAKLESVACCFNQKKLGVCYHIVKDCKSDNIMDFFKSSGCISEKTGLVKHREKYAHEFHRWLEENIYKCDNDYTRSCLNRLISWDACHNEYKNNLCEADLSELSSLIEISIIMDAWEKGIYILNAYDHAYSFNGFYDWKGEYKRYAEKYAVEFNRLFLLDSIGDKSIDYRTINLRKIANKINGAAGGKTLGKKNSLGKRNAAKDDVFNYVIENGIDEAQKKYGWDKNSKAYWNRKLKKYLAENN